MNLKLSILFLLIFCSTQAQKTIDKEVDHPIYGKAIEVKKYNDKDILVDKFTYTHDSIHTDGKYAKGKWTRYYENGEIEVIGYYVEPMKADFFGRRGKEKYGEWLFYNKDAKLASTLNYKDNKLNGAYINYHDNGEVLGKGTYKDGNIIGVAKLFFNNGQLHRAIKYSYGKPFNIVEFYDKSGKEIEFGTLKDGNGTLKLYDMSTGDFSELKTIEYGNPKVYDTKMTKTPLGTIKVLTYKFEDGGVKKIERYLNDELNGIQELFYRNEVLKEIRNYKNGIKDGKWQYFNEKGELVKEEKYINGILRS